MGGKRRDLLANVIPGNGTQTGILDLELRRIIGLGQDEEWKDLLRKYHTEARKFWLDFFVLCKYPQLNERGLEFPKRNMRCNWPNSRGLG